MRARDDLRPRSSADTHGSCDEPAHPPVRKLGASELLSFLLAGIAAIFHSWPPSRDLAKLAPDPDFPAPDAEAAIEPPAPHGNLLAKIAPYPVQEG